MQERDAATVGDLGEHSVEVLGEECYVALENAVPFFWEDQFRDDGCEPALTHTRPPVCEGQVFLVGRLVYVLTEDCVVPRRHCDGDCEVGEVA